MRSLTLFALTLAIVISQSPTASAEFITAVGRDTYYTFFKNEHYLGFVNPDGSINAGPVFESPAYTAVNDLASFKARTAYYLAGGYDGDPGRSPEDAQGAAAYMVATMMGMKGPDFGSGQAGWDAGIAYANAHWADWEARVDYYDSQGWINYNDTIAYCSPFIHYNLDYSLHDVFPYRISSGCYTDTMITFHDASGNIVYRFIKDCGNPNGELTGLLSPPPPPPPADTQPYSRFYNGDAQAGASFDCGVGSAPGGQISMFGDTGTGLGAGAQIGALAPGGIEGFASGQGSGSVGSLTFDNYGSAFCVPNYAALFDVPAVQPSIITGPHTINATIINAGARIDVLVRGDIHITGPLTFDNVSWASNTIPSYRVISLGGNIYIDPSVEQLDGLYVAIPDSGTGGAIYTCAGAGGALTAAEVAGACSNPLTVTGAFIANQVKLLRTYGDVASASAADDDPYAPGNTAAERFIFTPEVWMAQPATTPAPSYEYDAISSMPPVL